MPGAWSDPNRPLGGGAHATSERADPHTVHTLSGTCKSGVAVKAPMNRNRATGGTAVLLVLSTLILSACAQSSTGSGSSPPDTPVTGSPSQGGSMPTPKPQRVRPRPGLVDAHPVSWNTVEVVDQTTIDVLFYGGVEECYGLDHIDVKFSNDAVTVTLFEGRVPGAGVCIEMAMFKVTRVTLDEPLNGRKIVDGA
jgi:hypothetical protein